MTILQLPTDCQLIKTLLLPMKTLPNLLHLLLFCTSLSVDREESKWISEL